MTHSAVWPVRHAKDVLRYRRIWLPVLCFFLFLLLLWPPRQEPIYFWDSEQYLDAEWADYRLPGYRVFLSVLGTGYPLIIAQTLISLLAWAFLGWMVAGTWGLFAGAVLAGGLPVYQWNFVVLSESLSLSSIALILAATLLVAKRWTFWTWSIWVVCALITCMVRETNVFLVPFLVFPFFARSRRLWMTMLATAILVLAGKYVHSEYAMSYYDEHIRRLITCHVHADPAAHRFFVAAGMPDFMETSEGDEQAREKFGVWVSKHGVRAYLRWLLLRWTAYKEAWLAFLHCRNEAGTLRYGALVKIGVANGLLTRFYRWWGRVPVWVWLGGLLLPLVSQLTRRRMSPLVLLTASLVIATYVQAFFAFHGDFYFETWRHLACASLLYRVALGFGAAAIYQMVSFGSTHGYAGFRKSGREEREGSKAAEGRGAPLGAP